MHPLTTQGLQPNWGAFVQNVSRRGVNRLSVVAILATEQSELCRIARGLGEAKVPEGM
jgi:hypothetical protein